MKIDLTLCVTPELAKQAQENLKKAMTGHLGTHFDVMDKEFPLEYTERPAVVFDISDIKDRDVEISDIDLDKVTEGMFVAFYSGYIEEEGYGTKKYFREHPQLSYELVDSLMDRKISIIGIDFSGVRNGSEHTLMDQHCADRDVFIVENLCNLKAVVDTGDTFTARTYPLNFSDMTGLPCRVVAEL